MLVLSTPGPLRQTNQVYAGHKQLDTRARLIFARLTNFYDNFNVISTLLAGTSVAVLAFGEFSTDSALIKAAEGCLTSSSLTAIVSVVLAIMLRFKFEGHEMPTRLDLAVAWIPLVMLDISIVEFLLGLLLWYADKNNTWRTALMTAQFVALLVAASAVAVWMWNSMSIKGGLGKVEYEAIRLENRVADE